MAKRFAVVQSQVTPRGRVELFARRVVMSDGRLSFENFIFVCILTNTLVLAIETRDMEPWQKELSTNANIVFAAIFAICLNQEERPNISLSVRRGANQPFLIL